MSHDFALLMDLDGTLLDTDHLHIKAFHRLLQPLDRTITDEYYMSKIMGAPIDVVMNGLFPELSSKEQLALGEKKEVLFREQLVAQVEGRKGLNDFLNWARHHRFGINIVTNAPRDSATLMLGALGVLDFIDTILIGDEMPHSKPDPYPYIEAARLLGVDINKALAFEDSEPGIQSAAKAGVFTFGIEGALNRQQLLNAGASQTIVDYTSPVLWEKLNELIGTTLTSTGKAL